MQYLSVIGNRVRVQSRMQSRGRPLDLVLFYPPIAHLRISTSPRHSQAAAPVQHPCAGIYRILKTGTVWGNILLSVQCFCVGEWWGVTGQTDAGLDTGAGCVLHTPNHSNRADRCRARASQTCGIEIKSRACDKCPATPGSAARLGRDSALLTPRLGRDSALLTNKAPPPPPPHPFKPTTPGPTIDHC